MNEDTVCTLVPYFNINEGKLEVHGPAAEIDKLRGPMAALNPVFYELAPGGIRR